MNKTIFNVQDFIFDVRVSNFEAMVLDNSAHGPVLVHFWSRKSGPSFRLYPVLERLIEAYSGSFLLVNVDTDEQHKACEVYAITSVPTLKLFVNREVKETLFGYQNDRDLRFMLDQYIASENDIIIRNALLLYQQGRQEKAYQMLGQAALDSPHYYKLPLTIATLMQSNGRTEDALKLLLSLPEAMRQKATSQRLIIELEFADIAAPVDDARDLEKFVNQEPEELPASAILGAWYVTRKDYESALKLFHRMMQQDRSFEDDFGRRSMVKILSLLDSDNPLIKQYRNIIRKMSH